MESLTNGDKAKLPEDLVNSDLMAVSKEVKEQAGKVIGNIESVLKQDDKTDLMVIKKVVNKVEPTEGDQQVIGRPAAIAKKDTVGEKLIKFKELITDGTEDVIEDAIAHFEEVEDVAERVKRVLQFLENTEKIPELSNKDPEKCKEQACAAIEVSEIDNEEIKAKKRILKMCLETEETLKLFEEAEKTLDLLEESDNILSKLQENLQALQREKMSTQHNLEKVSQEMEMAINISAREFEQLNVDDNVQVQSESASRHESLQSNDRMTITPLSDPSVSENSPDSQPNFLKRITESMRNHCETCCFLLGCSLCLLCIVMCRRC